MRILFIADPMNTFKIHKDSTYAMMVAAAERGHDLFHTLSSYLYVQDSDVLAKVTPFTCVSHHMHTSWFQEQAAINANLTQFDAVIMRTDPPFNMQYLYATQLLTLAQQQGAKVFNSAQAIRDFNEKLAILNFSSLITPTVVTTQSKQVINFLEEYKDVIIKPLDGMGGMGIFRLRKDDPNIASILEMLMGFDTRTIMVQRYIPDIKQGDKRILIIDGEVIPYALARIPQQGETRGNLAAGGCAHVQDLSERDFEIAHTLASELRQRGIFLAGLDVIGEYLTEVNVTSPTGFQEIMQQKGLDVAKWFISALEKHVAA